MQNKEILCVEADLNTCELLQFLFETKGFRVRICNDGNEAIEIARENSFLAITLANWIGMMNGLFISSAIRRFDETTPIIFFNTSTIPLSRPNGLKTGAPVYLSQPNDFDKIVETIITLTSTNKQP